MIARSLLWSFIFFLLSSTTYAAEVHTEKGVNPKTAKRWTNALEHASFGSTSWIYKQRQPDRLHVSGRRDAILMVPSSSDPSSITLVVWFHGLGGFKDKTFRHRLMPQMNYIVEGGNSVALVVPEMPWSINTRTPGSRQGKVWQKQGELYRFISKVKLRLQRWAFKVHNTKLGEVRLVFVGHSAGGSAIKSSAIEGSLCRLKPESVIFSDASYGQWLDKAWRGCLKNASEVDLHILVRRRDKPHRNAERLMRVFRSELTPSRVFYQVLHRKHWSHTHIGDNALIISDIFPIGCYQNDLYKAFR